MKSVIRATGICLLFVLISVSHNSCFGQSATITGVVYEDDQVRTTFSLPKGKIQIYLPDDIRPGDVISGTVSATPNGKDEKEKKKNLAELIKYRLYLPDSSPAKKVKLPIPQNGPESFSFQVPSSTGNIPIHIELKTPDGQPITSAQLPTLPVFPTKFMTAPTAVIAKKVITNTEPIVVIYSGKDWKAPRIQLENYHTTASTGKAPENYTLEPISESPRKAVYTFPPQLSGMYKVCIEFKDEKSKFTDLVNIVDIRASIGKGNLLKGESTQLTVDVVGLAGCPYRPVQLELRNNTPQVIQLEQGNQQHFPIDQSDNPTAHSLHHPYATTQNVIGEVPGNFEITTTLHIPPSAYANTAGAFLDNASSPQSFNSTMNALKNDISQFVSDPGSDKILSGYLKQVKDQLPVANTPAALNQSRTMAGNMLNPVSLVPEGKSFMSGLNGMKQLHPAITEQAGISQYIHPLNDLAGEFDSKTRVLHFRESAKEGLLQYLGAQPGNKGTYSITVPEGQQPVTYADVQLKPMDVDINEPAGCNDQQEPLPAPIPGPTKKDEAEKEAVHSDTPPKVAGQGIGTKDPGTKADDAKSTGQPGETKPETASKDTTQKKDEYKAFEWPEGKSVDFTDSTGRKYKFYQNAECKELYSIEGNRCSPEMNYGEYNPKTGKRDEDKPTGNYAKYIFQSSKRCVKGTGFCTEMWQITTVKMIYSDKDCQNLIKTVNYEDFRCQ